MKRPLYKGTIQQPAKRNADGHAGLWFDKFCNQWRVVRESWKMSGEQKLKWIKPVADLPVGTQVQIDECAQRLKRLIRVRGGRWGVFTTESRFVTGLGRSHPVENGFAWHPTLGTPYLPGSSVKGLVRAWTKLDADSAPTSGRLLGDRDSAGSISFLDAIPIAPVLLEADIMTPHYAGWTESDPPGDWRSPTPIPFLTTAVGMQFLFGVFPCATVTQDDLSAVMSWLRSALEWAGAGAKTAVGYGRFKQDKVETEKLGNRVREQEKQMRAEQKKQERFAKLSPIERKIEEVLERRQNMPEHTAILKELKNNRWEGNDKVEAARWVRDKMKENKKWKKISAAKRPERDKDHQNTLLVKSWLEGE